MGRYGIPVLLWSACNHTATSFWPTAIPVWRMPLNSCKIYCLLRSARNLSGKSLELLRPDVFLRRKIYQKCVYGRGSAPDPTVGAFSTPPNLLAGFKGPTYKRRGGPVGEVEPGRDGKGDGREMKEGESEEHTGTFFPTSSPV